MTVARVPAGFNSRRRGSEGHHVNYANDPGEVGALYRAVLRDPEDRTLRMALADRLDERGAGDDADRAALIRAQCRAAEHAAPGRERGALLDQAARILQLHPEWARSPCERCSGAGTAPPVNAPCTQCFGSGDLFLETAHWTRVVLFWYGFPDDVSCRTDELGRQADNVRPGTRPPFLFTRWAYAVAGAYPVTRFRLSDRVPHPDTGDLGWREAVSRREDWAAYDVPADIWDDLGGTPANLFSAPRVDGRDAARSHDALARAAGRCVRRIVYPPPFPETLNNRDADGQGKATRRARR